MALHLGQTPKFLTPCCIGDDFNTVLTAEERKGGDFNRYSAKNFQDFILRAKVVDIPLRGIPFTWSNYRENACWARLDRFLVSHVILS